MPDTVFTRAVRGIINEEEDNVDAQDLRDWLKRIEKKLDDLGVTQSVQGERIAKVEEKSSAAHRRLDEAVRTLRGPGKPAWVGIIVAMITATAAIVVAYFTRK